jgi:TRAP-type transport system small permease protein
MYSILNRVATWVDRCLKWYIVLLMGLMVFMTFIQVVARYVMQSPFTSTEEYTRMVLVWLTFMGAAAALRRNRLTRIEVLEELLPAGVRRFLAIFFDLVLMFLLLIIAVKGWEATMVTTSQIVAGTPLSYAWFVFSVVVGSVIMFFYLGLRRLQSLLGRVPSQER